MGREYCSMCYFLGDEAFCDYYDFGYMKCEDKEVCPDGLDDGDDWGNYEGYEPE
jgi:hypothetical protein